MKKQSIKKYYAKKLLNGHKFPCSGRKNPGTGEYDINIAGLSQLWEDHGSEMNDFQIVALFILQHIQLLACKSFFVGLVKHHGLPVGIGCDGADIHSNHFWVTVANHFVWHFCEYVLFEESIHYKTVSLFLSGMNLPWKSQEEGATILFRELGMILPALEAKGVVVPEDIKKYANTCFAQDLISSMVQKACEEKYDKQRGVSTVWTPQEEQDLLEAVRVYGTKWRVIIKEVPTIYSNSDYEYETNTIKHEACLQMKFSRMMALNDSRITDEIRKKALVPHEVWTKDEEEALIVAVSKYGRNWKTVGAQVPSLFAHSDKAMMRKYMKLETKENHRITAAAEQHAATAEQCKTNFFGNTTKTARGATTKKAAFFMPLSTNIRQDDSDKKPAAKKRPKYAKSG
jgi:hypothetical protein